MRLFFHFAVIGFSNTYLLGGENGGDAVLIDPGVMDLPLLQLIEKNNYYIRSILLTHDHKSHVNGIKTIKKIYDADIYANSPLIFEYTTKVIRDGDHLSLNDIEIDILEVPGHSSDSLIFRVEDVFFSGDAFGAGSIGSTPNSYARALLVNTIRDKIFSQEDHLIILPGHGPPSTVGIERDHNPYLKRSI
jgi:glyoxylase-like metal-dependent hydrolase (beta-lactamase superfamily II)